MYKAITNQAGTSQSVRRSVHRQGLETQIAPVEPIAENSPYRLDYVEAAGNPIVFMSNENFVSPAKQYFTNPI